MEKRHQKKKIASSLKWFSLGNILIQGLVKRKPLQKRTQDQKKTFRRFSFFKYVSLQDSNKRSLSSDSALAPLPVSPIPPESQSSSSQTLQIQELLNPNDQMRQCIESFLLNQRSFHTRLAYGKDLKRFIQFLYQKRLSQKIDFINRAIMISYKEFLISQNLEDTTIDRHLATLRSFFQWLIEEGVIEKSPVEGVRFLNPKKISKTIGLTDEEVRSILSKPNQQTRTGATHYAILSILFYCGLRRSELCGLKTSDIGVQNNQKFLRLRGKGNRERIIVIVSFVWQAIENYCLIASKDLNKESYLFTPIRNNRTGVLNKPLDPSMIFYIVSFYAKKAGIVNRISPHSCRATAISNARDHRVSDRAIQEFAGWSSPVMITQYDKRKTAIEDCAAHWIDYENRKNKS